MSLEPLILDAFKSQSEIVNQKLDKVIYLLEQRKDGDEIWEAMIDLLRCSRAQKCKSALKLLEYKNVT